MALTDLFTSIANSIRSKDGTTEEIQASAFPQRISDLPSGNTANFASGTFTLVDNQPTVTIEHGLGKTPNVSIIIPLEDSFTSAYQAIWSYIANSINNSTFGIYSNWGNMASFSSKTQSTDSYDETNVVFNGNTINNNMFFKAGIKYTWIVGYAE